MKQMLLSKKHDLQLELKHKTEFRSKQTALMERMISLQQEEIRQSSLEIEVLENSLRTIRDTNLIGTFFLFPSVKLVQFVQLETFFLEDDGLDKQRGPLQKQIHQSKQKAITTKRPQQLFHARKTVSKKLLVITKEPKKRGRPLKEVAETKKRGRPSKSIEVAETKKRGRPPKSIEVAETPPKETPPKETPPKKRGRPSAVVKSTSVAGVLFFFSSLFLLF